MRETLIPLSAVLALIERQEAFNAQLIDKLGLYLREAADAYKDALNPPLESTPSVPMNYSPLTDEADDLMHQIESGQISLNDIPDSLRKLLGDAELSIDTP